MSTALAVLATLVAAAVFLGIGANLSTAEKRLRHRPQPLYGSDAPDFKRALGILLGPPLVGGNHVTTLVNGDQIFPSMLEAIESARVTIAFETFVFRDEVGGRFCAALSRAAKRGVKVHILLDWVGSSKMDTALLENTRKAGCDVELYHPLSWIHLGRLNNRTHRKLLVVDGRVGFTGGVGMGNEWIGNAEDPKHWREMHYRVEGPVVSQMQAVFIDNWIKATGHILHGPDYFPTEDVNAGDMEAQMFGSSPSGGSESMHLMILLALTAARKTIDIENAYFVPDPLTMEALVAAAKRGVRVRVVVPGRHTDARVGRWAAQALYGDLMKAGIEIHEYQRTMIHCKVLVIDGAWTSVGSANFDDRSFRLNDEANLNVFSEELADAQVRQIEEDIRHSKKMSPRRWARRMVSRRIYERLALLMRSQL